MTQEQLQTRLSEPLPAEAIKPHPSKSYLSTINSIYVTERLNQVFGVGRWGTTSEVIEQGEKMIVLRVHLWANSPVDGQDMIKLEAYGGNDNVDRGDAYKGAMTDALTKIGSFLGIGADVWKDKGPKGSQHRPQRAQASRPTSSQGQTPSRDSEPTSWLNLSDKDGFVNERGQQILEGVRLGEYTIDMIKSKYKINKRDFELLQEAAKQ
jgi:hypothetical protein